jgi:hypothetical protein
MWQLREFRSYLLNHSPLAHPPPHTADKVLEVLEPFWGWVAARDLLKHFARSVAAAQTDESIAGLLERLSDLASTPPDVVKSNLELVLERLGGEEFGSLDANRSVAEGIHRLVERLALRVACPRCGVPAYFACTPAGRAKNGVFVFQHPINGKQKIHFTAAALPRNLRAIPAPADQRRRRKSEK